MIDPDWLVVDLDPATWRNVTPLIQPSAFFRAGEPGEHGLYVLHAGGRPLHVVDTDTGVRRDLAIPAVHDPQQLAKDLHALGQWDRVHVIDRRHLAEVGRLAQQPSNREPTIDAYYRLVYHLLWDDSRGYVTAPACRRNWHGWTYEGFQRFLARLPEAATLGIAVADDARIEVGLILDVRQGRVVGVTTFEAFREPLTSISPSPEGVADVWRRLEDRARAESDTRGPAALPAFVIVMSRVALAALLAHGSKRAALRATALRGETSWRRTADVHIGEGACGGPPAPVDRGAPRRGSEGTVTP
jgi:hypothetical protein